MMMRVGIQVALNGPMITFSSWEQRDSRPISGLALRTGSNSFRNSEYRYAS